MNTSYWTTDVYKTTYLNDFIFYGLRKNFLSKVIVNGMSGSFLKFRRFVMISLQVLNLDREMDMTDFIDSEVSVEGNNKNEEKDDKVSDSDFGSLKSLIDDNDEIENDRTFYRKFKNVKPSIVLKEE